MIKFNKTLLKLLPKKPRNLNSGEMLFKEVVQGSQLTIQPASDSKLEKCHDQVCYYLCLILRHSPWKVDIKEWETCKKKKTCYIPSLLLDWMLTPPTEITTIFSPFFNSQRKVIFKQCFNLQSMKQNFQFLFFFFFFKQASLCE